MASTSSAKTTETAPPPPPLDVAYARLIAWLTDRRILPPSTAWRTSLEKVHRQVEVHTSKKKAIACNIDDVDRKVLRVLLFTFKERERERERERRRRCMCRVYIHTHSFRYVQCIEMSAVLACVRMCRLGSLDDLQCVRGHNEGGGGA